MHKVHYQRPTVTSVRAALFLLIASLTSCSVITPDQQSQKVDSDLVEFQLWQQQQPESAQSISLLTDLIAIDELQLLVKQGLAANPGLQQTALTLEIAYATANIESGKRWPELDLTLNQQRAKDTDRSFNSSLNISWTLDIWGKLDDAVNAAEANALSAQFAHLYARDVLAARIMDTWLQLVLQQNLIEIETNRLAVLKNNEALIIERYRKGLNVLSDLDSARSTTESSRATLSEAMEALAKLQRQMALLLGNPQQPIKVTHSQFPETIVPLATMPQQTLARRPDLLQAYQDIIAADYQAAVAYKNLLPSISLQGALTDSASNLNDALLNSPGWNLLGQLSAPLFRGGQLKSAAEVAKLNAEKAYWAYRETLLSAVDEVENSLSLENSISQQQQHIRFALQSAKRSLVIYQEKYRNGLATLIELLTVKRQTFNLQSQLTNLTYQRLSNRITLGLALGLGASA